MPRSPSPPREPRRDRSRSPRRERSPRRDRRDDERARDRDYDRRPSDRDRPRDYDRRPSERDRDVDGRSRDDDRGGSSARDRDYDSRDRSPPPASRGPPKRAKELSFYKKSSAPVGSFSQRRDPLDGMTEESAKERMERRDRGEVPARFGGTREQGVRNTMSSLAPQGTANTSMGSFRRTGDPLDRMSSKKGEDYGRSGGAPNGDAAQAARLAAMSRAGGAGGATAPTGVPVRPSRMIEVIANSRTGQKVRIKCLPTDTIGDLKRLIAAQTGTTAGKIQLKKWYTAFKDHVQLQDYEIHDGMSLEMY